MHYSIVPHPDPAIFRAYDIRGIVDTTLRENEVYTLGLALGTQAQQQGFATIVVGRDGRLSGPALIAALQAGLQASGCHVIDIGMVPTPVLYFATHYLHTQCGIMLTGSHNPVNYNGLKMILGGTTLAENAIQALYQRIKNGDFITGQGTLTTRDVIAAYCDRIKQDVQLQRRLKIVIDCGNGVTGMLAPQLFRSLGCEVTELLCEVDGYFPHHHPDPTVPENLCDLIHTVKQSCADIGIAFDGDGDRLGVVTDQGEIIWPDRQLMLFAQSILKKHLGAQIIFDVKCSNHLAHVITQAGGQPLMWKTGHSLIKAKLKETQAPLAGEMSGHIFFNDTWYGFDDGLYSAARLLEILASSPEKPSAIFAKFPNSVNTPELKLPIAEDQKFSFMETLKNNSRFGDAKLTTLDGIRADFSDGWGLVRPSNTSPYLILRFEAVDQHALQRIQNIFRTQLLALDKDLRLPF